MQESVIDVIGYLHQIVIAHGVQIAGQVNQ